LKYKYRDAEFTPKPKVLITTPTGIGNMKFGKKRIGDAGYGMEEAIFGGRMFHCSSKDSGPFHLLALGLKIGRERFLVNDSNVTRKKIKLLDYVPLDDEKKLYSSKKLSISNGGKGASLFVFPEEATVLEIGSYPLGSRKA
jgi:hypothetical protein